LHRLRRPVNPEFGAQGRRGKHLLELLFVAFLELQSLELLATVLHRPSQLAQTSHGWSVGWYWHWLSCVGPPQLEPRLEKA
jgi:hypothetical protein